MTKIQKLFSFLILSSLLINCTPKTSGNFEQGTLWRIQSKNGTNSYLFGTIHFYPKAEISLSNTVLEILSTCSTLALERDITNQAEQKKFLDYPLPDALVQSLKIIFLAYGNELVSMENEIIMAAMNQNLTITGLETTDEVLNILDQLPLPQTSDSLPSQAEVLKIYQETIHMYQTEAIDGFHNITIADMGKDIVDLMINQRNENWLDDIITNIESTPTFIAVGMGHLGGKNGLLDLLEKKGYQLERVSLQY